MSNQDIPNLTPYWKKYPHKRAFVYKPYYNNAYIYWDEPYFISEYISKYDEIYDPTLSNEPDKIKLEDGTVIEAFSGKVISRGKPIPGYSKRNRKPSTTLTRPEIPEPRMSRPDFSRSGDKKPVIPILTVVPPTIPSKKTVPKPVPSKKKIPGKKGKKKTKITLPKPSAEPKVKDEPPVELPSYIPKNKWRKWWRINRHLYGDRDYYYDLGYPVWWLDYYYPIYDDYNYYDDIWDDVGLFENDNIYVDNITYDSDDDVDEKEKQQQQTQRTDDQKKELDRMMLPQFMMMGVIMFLMIVILFLILNRKNI